MSGSHTYQLVVGRCLFVTPWLNLLLAFVTIVKVKLAVIEMSANVCFVTPQ